MRKFLAILAALFLALVLLIGIRAWQQGLSLRDMNAATAQKIVTDFFVRSKPAEAGKPRIEVVQPEEENLSYQERLQKGDYFFDRGFLTFAVNEYVKASNLEPKQSAPYLKLLRTHMMLGDYEKARRSADTLLVLEPDNPEASNARAQIDLRQGHFPEAQKRLEELMKTAGDDAQVNYNYALLKILTNDLDGGKHFLSNASGQSPAPELKAKIDTLLKAYQEFEFAQAAEPLYLSELLARAFNQNKDYEFALFKLKEVLRARSDLRDAWILLGFSYLNLGDDYFALTAFQRAYELDSEWPATQYFLGLTNQALGDNDKAILYFNDALHNQFEPALVVKQKLAELYLNTKNYTMAINLYKEIVTLNKDDVQAFVRPIWIDLDFLNQPQDALALAQNAVTAFPENAMAYNLLGWAQTGTGDFTAAEKNLKKSLDIDPNLTAGHLNLGKLYETQKRFPEAKDSYQKAYNLDPNGSIGRLAAQRYNDLMQTNP